MRAEPQRASAEVVAYAQRLALEACGGAEHVCTGDVLVAEIDLDVFCEESLLVIRAETRDDDIALPLRGREDGEQHRQHCLAPEEVVAQRSVHGWHRRVAA